MAKSEICQRCRALDEEIVKLKAQVQEATKVADNNFKLAKSYGEAVRNQAKLLGAMADGVSFKVNSVFKYDGETAEWALAK